MSDSSSFACCTRLNVVPEVLSCLVPGEVIFLGGRPNAGKTDAGVRLAERYAQEDKPSLIFNLEMPREVLIRRFKKWDKAQQIIIEDQADWGASFPDILVQSREVSERRGIKLIVIDYLELLPVDGMKNRKDETEYILQHISALAAELNLPVVLMGMCHFSLCEADVTPKNSLPFFELIKKYADKIVLLMS